MDWCLIALCGTDRRVRMGAAKEKALGEGRQSSTCRVPGGLSSRSPPMGMRAVRAYSAAVCGGIWGLLLLLNLQIQSTKGNLVVRDSRKRVEMVMEEYAAQPGCARRLWDGCAASSPSHPTVQHAAWGKQCWCALHPHHNSGWNKEGEMFSNT